MKNPLLNHSFDKLAEMYEENLVFLQYSSSTFQLQDEMTALLNSITEKLTNKQYDRFQFSNETLEQITKSKKLLTIYSKWQLKQKELQFVLDTQKLVDDIEYTIKQKRLSQRPTLAYSAEMTMYDVMLRRIAKHSISSAQSASDRTKKMTKNALRLCK